MKQFFKTVVVEVLSWEARLLLKRTKPKIVAITGNVGKTSTKDAVYTVLKDHKHTRRSEKGFNTEIGVPLTVLGLRNAWNNPFRWLKNIVDGFLQILHPGTYPEVLVLEMGVDHPGDMRRLASWVKPDVVVITRLPDVPVHVEYFDSPDAVINEKLELLHALKSDGVFVYNHDDERIRKAAEGIHQQALGYSRYSESHFTASGDRVRYEGGFPIGISFILEHFNEEISMHVVGSLGVQHAYNYAAAVAVGTVFGVPIEEAAEALSTHECPPGRMHLLRGIKDTLIIDDSYNSSPTAMERSLQALRELTGMKRKVAILGDMLELGQYSVRAHESAGEDVANSADVLITVGIRARKIAEGALEFGMSEKNIFQYDSVERAQKDIREMIESGDVILVKASQSMRLEKIVAEIMAEPGEREKLLVRQDPEWLRR